MRSPIRALARAALPALVVVGIAACAPLQPLPLPTPTESVAVSPTPTPTPGPDVTEIADVAVEAAGAGTVVAVEDESAGRSFEVRIVDESGAEQEVHLDGDGVVRAGPSAGDTDVDERSDNRALVAAAAVTLSNAADRMTTAVPDGRITAIQLDEVAERVAWVGDVTDADGVRHDVRIDAVNGSVLLDRPDEADENADQEEVLGGS